MFKKIVSFILVVLLMQTSVALANPNAEKEAQRAEKVRASLLKLGLGPDARVEIKLRDKTKLAGYVSEVGEESFTLVNASTGAPTAIAYPLVGQVKGHNLSTGAKIAIGVGLAAAVVVGLFLIKRICNESSC